MADPTERHVDAYYDHSREDFLGWVSGTHRSVLEVGCAAGANAQWYRQHGAGRLVGVELDATSADRARPHFDDVIAEPIETAMDHIRGPFDLIVCADVLEHLVDPWSVTRRLRSLAGPGGSLAISIPNVRFYRALARIALGKGFRYDPEGIFDVTHLRFFARSNVDALLKSSGWKPVRWGGNRPRARRLASLLERLTAGRSDEWLVYQWWVVAKASSDV